MKPFYIYRIYNTIDNKSYIGQTGDYRGRIAAHFSNLRAGINWNSPMQVAFNQHGETAFSYELLEIAYRHNVNEREIYWMAHFSALDGIYNTKKGGANGHLHRPTVKYQRNLAEIEQIKGEIETKSTQLIELQREIKRLKRRLIKLETRREIL